MNASEVRTWIGKYFLLVLSVIAGYIYIFAETVLLPIARTEAYAAGETIIPVLLGQLAIIYRWFFSGDSLDLVGDVTVPAWLVRWPPMLAIGLIAAAIASLVIANSTGGQWAPDPEMFRRVVVFSVSMLNVTTVIVITRYFAAKSVAAASSPDGTPH